MKNPQFKFDHTGVRGAFDHVTRGVTKIERRGEQDVWQPGRFAVSVTEPNDPQEGQIWYDARHSKLKIWNKRWREVALV